MPLRDLLGDKEKNKKYMEDILAMSKKAAGGIKSWATSPLDLKGVLSNVGPQSSYDEARGEFVTQPPERMTENPAGYVTDSVLGGFGAPGALATIAGASGEAVRGARLGTVGGALAKGFDEAKQLGKTWKGLEGAPKFEIADDAARMVGDLPKFLQTKKLKDILDHPELFSQYPDLANMDVQKLMPMLSNADKGGEFLTQGGNPIARVRGDRLPEDIKSTLLHEIQHAIQDKEKWPLSEGEAHSVQGRMNMNDAERQANPFNSGTPADLLQNKRKPFGSKSWL